MPTDVLRTSRFTSVLNRAILAACLMVVVATTAHASHFRYGHIYWNAIHGEHVEFVVQMAFRRSEEFLNRPPTPDTPLAFRCVDPFFATSNVVSIPCTGLPDATTGRPLPGVGDIIFEEVGGTMFFPGDGSMIGSPLKNTQGMGPLLFLVTSVDITNDWLFTFALDPDSLPMIDFHIDHTYTTPGPWTAFVDDCCRLAPAGSDPHAAIPTNVHVNNPDGGYRIETVVELWGHNKSPRTALMPIVCCEVDEVCEFQIPVVDPNRDRLTCRLSDSDEASSVRGFEQPGMPSAPNAATVGTDTCIYSWDTTGAQFTDADSGTNTLYSTQVTIEDHNSDGMILSKTAVDFFIRVMDDDPQVAVFEEPLCGERRILLVGEEHEFEVEAESGDEDFDITLTVAGLPPGAEMDRSLPRTGESPESEFEWTPTIADVGTHVVTFAATDESGCTEAMCSVTLEVVEEPPCDDVIDFETDKFGDKVPEGTQLSKVFSARGLGPFGVKGVNSNLDSSVNVALVFDSDCPGGCESSEYDLGTPNEDFGGPGIGEGGEKHAPFENAKGLHNVLIVGKDLDDDNGDGLLDHVDSESDATQIRITFDNFAPVTIKGIAIIDVDDREDPAVMELYDENDDLLRSVTLPVTGNNGVAKVALDQHVRGVWKMVVNLSASAAIDKIRLAYENCPDIACGDHLAPVCGGECTQLDEICMPNSAGDACSCVQKDVECGESDAPTCGGRCPHGKLCGFDAALDSCQCDDVSCGDSAAPECGGGCDPMEACAFDSDTATCVCEPTSCGDSSKPTCGGICPDDEACVLDWLNKTCVCESQSCAAARAPQCGGNCPLDEVCVPNPSTGHCGCEPVHCFESEAPSCGGQCPEDKHCIFDPAGYCSCEPAPCEATGAPTCAGACSPEEVCVQDKGTGYCRCLAHTHCASAPVDGCAEAGRVDFQLIDNVDSAKDKLRWRWRAGEATPLADLGDPEKVTGYRLCVYDRNGADAALAMELDVPSSPSWSNAGSRGYRYRDGSGEVAGVVDLRVDAGSSGRAQAGIKARGANMPDHSPAGMHRRFDALPSLTVQMVNDAGKCWTSDFSTPRRNTRTKFKASSR